MTPISPMSAADVANIRLKNVPRLLAFPALCIMRYRETRRNSCVQNNPVRITLVRKASNQASN